MTHQTHGIYDRCRDSFTSQEAYDRFIESRSQRVFEHYQSQEREAGVRI